MLYNYNDKDMNISYETYFDQVFKLHFCSVELLNKRYKKHFKSQMSNIKKYNVQFLSISFTCILSRKILDLPT